MNSKILCKWLGIVSWPPDHYALLGLQPGEGDVARIEQQVQERMARLRCYQLSHPEEATEGMNRVAQAFICLTDPLSRQSYSAAGNAAALSPGAGVAVAKPAAFEVETQQLQASETKTEVDWQNSPPPVRIDFNGSGSVPATTKAPILQTPAATQSSASPVPEPIDMVFELAHQSVEARRGLGTLPALIERINQTLALLLAWNGAGRYLSNPLRKLGRAAEETDLTRRLVKVFELTEEFPKIVGHPGQPGYRVVAMARLEMTSQMFKGLDKTQREDLARDWDAGYRVLLSHRQFLRRQFKTLRHRGPIRLILGAVRSALNDHPVGVCTGVLLVIGLCLTAYFKLFFRH